MKTGITGSTAGTLLLAVLLLRGVGWNPAPQTDSGHSRERATNQREQSHNSEPPVIARQGDGPWEASRQHFAGRPGNDCSSFTPKLPSQNATSSSGTVLSRQGKHAKAGNSMSRLWCIPSGARIGAMIAIVPDPVHSHLSLLFDRTLEALQVGAGTMNYVVDRYWLPWRLDLDLQNDASRQVEPGLLLFRWNGAPDRKRPEVIYVFLVADTSTAGINGAQFRHAVQYVQQLSGAQMSPARCGTERRVWIMGPTFSGSLASLRQLTTYGGKSGLSQQWPDFSAYSGTVSSSSATTNQNLSPANAGLSSSTCGEVQQVATKLLKENGLQTVAALGRTASASSSHPPRLTFGSVLRSSEDVVSTFLYQLKDNGDISCDSGHQTEVAIFSETSTTYGGATGNAGSYAQRGCTYTSFRFPREISSLRNASAAIESQATSSAQPGNGRPYGYLPFSLADREPNSSDEPPSFARAQEPLSQQAVLMNYAAELQRGHYKYVGIVATNILDVLFVARFLRSACPDIRLFMLNADLLFERDLDNDPYIGMLSVSTYPLISRGPDWISQEPLLPRLPFADQYEEGQYRAFVLVMGKVLNLSQSQVPEAARLSWGPTGGINAPVWVTALGTGGYWPIQILSSELPAAVSTTGGPTQAAGYRLPDLHLDARDFSPSWRMLAFLLAVLALFQSFLCTAPPVGIVLREFSLMNAAPAQRFFFVNAASASLVFTLAIVAAPAWKFGLTAGLSVSMIALTVFAAATVLVAANLYLGCVLMKICNANRTKASGCWSMMFSALIWLAAGLGVWLWWSLLRDDASRYGFFFAYRAVNLATGVSPLTPMLPLASAIYLWSIGELWRLRFADEVRPRLNLPEGLPGAYTEQRIVRSITSYFLDRKYVAGFIAVWTLWIIFFNPVQPFQLFERRLFALFYGELLVLVVALMLSAAFRLEQTWSMLQSLLDELETSPLRQVFTRQHGREQDTLSRMLRFISDLQTGTQAEWTNMSRSFELVHKIKKNDPQLTPELADTINRLEKVLAQLRQSMTEFTRSRTESFLGSGAERILHPLRQVRSLFFDLQNLLASLLRGVLEMLYSHWEHPGLSAVEDVRSEAVPVLASAPNPGTASPRTEGLIQQLEDFAALRYTVFINGVRAHIRRLLFLLVVSFTLVLLSINMYAFEPHLALVWSLTIIFVAIGFLVIKMLMQVHRNEILSRIDGTKPGQLGGEFYLRVISLGAAPLITLLATHFPSLGRYLLSLLQPGMEALK